MKSRWITVISLLVTVLGMPLFVYSVQAKPEGKLVIAYNNLGNEALDCIKEQAREEQAILNSLGDPLILREWEGVNGVVRPAIGVSWKASPDLKTWEIKIRKDVTFQDGTPLTIEDVIYTWNRIIKSPLSRAVSAKRLCESVEAVGDDRIIFNLKIPFPFWLYSVGSYPIHPKAYVEKVGDKTFGEKPIYAGPWKFVKQVLGDYVEMEAFEKHYRKVPYAKKLILKKVPEQSTQLAMLKTGEADIMFQVPVGPMIRELQKDPNLKIITTEYTGEFDIFFTELAKKEKVDSIFWDKRIRQALSYGIDRQLIADKLYYGLADPIPTCCIIQGSEQWHPSTTAYPYDMEKAKSLLAEAGYPKGFETRFIATSREKVMAEAIATMWAKIGVKAKIEMYEIGALLETIRKRTTPPGPLITRHQATPLGMGYYFRKDQVYTIMNDDKLHNLTMKMLTFPAGSEMNAYIRNEMAPYLYDLVPCIAVINPLIVNGVNPGLGVDEWVKLGTRRINYAPAAEHIIPRK